MYLHCISRGYTHSGLFLTNFIVLWFSTLTIILVKLVIFFVLVKTVCKACYNLYINAQVCYFCCILGPLWPVTSEATVAPLPLYSSNMGLRSACAHEEVYTLQMLLFISINKAKYTNLLVFTKNTVFPYFDNSHNLVHRPELLIFVYVCCQSDWVCFCL